MRKVLSEAGMTASHPISVPAPVGGWNARDALALMKPSDAVWLDNWFPGTTTVDIRPGCSLFATLPVGGLCRTLMTCAKEDGTTLKFAVTQLGVYSIDAGGTISVLGQALTDSRVQYTGINVAGISYLWACNGVDKSFVYKADTATFIPLDGASVPVLTGITSTDVVNVDVWKYRVILCKKNSLSFYYGPLNSVGGAFSAFDLGQLFRKGGYLMATANWTIDAGNGPDDRFVAISSEGEVAIYQGTDPSALSTFSLVGVFDIGRPVGRRCCVQIAGDLAILTESGLRTLSKALQSATLNRTDVLTDKIQHAFNSYYQQFKAQFAWQPVLYPQGTALIVNIPLRSTVSYQFVMNTITGAWCRFLGWSAEALMVAGGSLYYALGNKVYLAWTGTDDAGASIEAVVKTAFQPGARRGRISQIKLVKPTLTADFDLTVQLALDTDYEDRRLLSSVTNFNQAVARWDVARYNLSVWSGGNVTINRWRTVAHKPGNDFALRMRISVRDTAVTWAATQFISEAGGIFS